MTTNFTTHAGNFSAGLSSAVDPRTGLYTLNLSLLSLTANNQLGPAIELPLSYSPLSAENIGFGNGFTPGLSSYDTTTGLLTLSSGERYRVSETPDQLVIRQKKLNTFIFRKSADRYEIVWKNGTTEILHGPSAAVRVKYPVRILSPAGRHVDLSWDYTGPLPRLTRVADEFRTLLTVDYYGSISTVMNILPDSEEKTQLTLLFANNNLASLTRYASGSADLKWVFRYQAIDPFYPISGIDYPTGLQESVIYQAAVMRFPYKSGLAPLPAVVSFRRYPGASQPPSETRWSWSDNNYLGYGGNADWNADDDFNYDSVGRYQYSSTETLNSSDISLITTRYYNRFHLLTEESTRRDGAVTRRTISYYADELKTFAEQPPQFLLPRETTDTRIDPQGQARSRTTLTTFDEHGNPLTETGADGTVTTLSWYPPQGDDGCPPEPNGFTRFLKQKHIRYPESHGYDDVPDTTETFTYTQLGNSPCVVQATHSVFSDATLLQTQSTEYDDVTGSPEFGRTLATTETVYSAEDDGEYRSVMAFSTTLSASRLIQQATFTGYDGLSSVTSRTSSALSGLLYEETDILGVTTTYAYDGYGRIVRRTLAAGSAYENTTSWAYRISGTPVTVQTGPTGVEETTYFDGAGRVVSRHMLDLDASQKNYEFYTARYNELGETVSETTLDWETANAAIPLSTLTAQAEYDRWGQLNTLRMSDGLTSLTTSDPVQLTRLQQLQGQQPAGNSAATTNNGTIKHYYDQVSLQLSRSERYGVAGDIQGTAEFLWDGRSLLRYSTDECGNTTTFTYDARGRELTRTLPDGSLVTRRYAPHLSDEQVTAISVTGRDTDDNIQHWQVGTQSFDSLGRLTQSVSGGRTTCYIYEGSSPQPTTVILPSGNQIRYTYIPELGNALGSVTAEGLTQTFEYDSLTGRPLHAAEGLTSNHNTWTASGLLQTETITLGSDIRQAAHTHTLGGVPATYTDISGKKTAYEYDIHGRPIAIIDEALQVHLEYDPFGRLHRQIATDTSTSTTQTVTLGYDDFDREIARTLADASGTTLVLTQTWRENNQLEGRITQQNGTLLKDERYTYDSRNRLIDYRVSGTAPPLDAYGHPLAGQTFRYDALNNLITMTTTLAEGGSDTAKFYYDNPLDPMQLSRVTHTHVGYPQAIELAYDAEGRLILDEAGRTLKYDILGRLIDISSDNPDEGKYAYDALNRLVTQHLNTEDRRQLYYRGNEQVNEVLTQQNREVRLIKSGHTCIGVADGNNLTLTTGDEHNSLLWSRRDEQGEVHAWAPYGSGEKQDLLPGFNGERIDPLTGNYHLGNGYRAYNPVLMRFNCPDSLSPFGAGGINPYAYCLGDPINRLDPSGHISWQSILGMVLGVAGLMLTFGVAGAAIAAAGGVAAAIGSVSKIALAVGVLGVAADITGIVSGAIETIDPEMSSGLGWASMGLGIAGLGIAGLGMAGAVKAIPKMRARRIATDRMVNHNDMIVTHTASPNSTIRGPIYSLDVHPEDIKRFTSNIDADMGAALKSFKESAKQHREKQLIQSIKRDLDHMYTEFEKIGGVHASRLKNSFSVRFGTHETYHEFRMPDISTEQYYQLSSSQRKHYNRTARVMSLLDEEYAAVVGIPVPTYDPPYPPIYQI